MTLLKWDEKYSVNVREIDTQHKHWINILNDLDDSIKDKKGRLAVGAALDSLVDFARVHFNTEEELMKSTAYPFYSGHKKIHEDITRELDLLKMRYSSGEELLGPEVMSFLMSWLDQHLLTTDKNYSLHLNANGVY